MGQTLITKANKKNNKKMNLVTGVQPSISGDVNKDKEMSFCNIGPFFPQLRNYTTFHMGILLSCPDSH